MLTSIICGDGMIRGLEDSWWGGGHALVLNKLCLHYNYVNLPLRLPLWEINPRLPAYDAAEFGPQFVFISKLQQEVNLSR